MARCTEKMTKRALTGRRDEPNVCVRSSVCNSLQLLSCAKSGDGGDASYSERCARALMAEAARRNKSAAPGRANKWRA